jgi:hypothetical protein
VFNEKLLTDMEEFEDWIVQIGGITEDGRKKLEKATVVSVTAVKHLTVEDIAEIRLCVGDRGIFRAAWQQLQTTAKEPEEPVVPIVEPPVTDEESRLYSIREISKYFGGLPPRQDPNRASGSGIQHPSRDGRTEALAAASAIGTAANAGADVTSRVLAKDRLLTRLAAEYAQGGVQDALSIQQLNLATFQGEKVLLPVNFATVFNGCALEEEELLGCGQYAGRLVWQSGKGNSRRPTPDRLSFGQFFEACARIQNLLVLNDTQKIAYLDYLRQIGILLQTFTASSVFCLDHLHRNYIFESGACWNVIENTLENSVLKKKEENRYAGNPSAPQRRTDSKPRSIDGPKSSNKEGRVCWLYNLYKGCHFGDACEYPHVCSVDNCRGPHPAYQHLDAGHQPPPQFYKKADPGKQSA